MFFVEQVLVRGLHVLAGSFWFGAAVVMAAFLSPAARRAGKPGAAFMRVLNSEARLPVFTNVAALITIITGLWLLWRVSGGLQGTWFATSYGLTLTIGLLAALVVYAISVGGRGGAAGGFHGLHGGGPLHLNIPEGAAPGAVWSAPRGN